MAVRTPRSEVLVRQRLRALAQALPAAREGDVGAVHQARVATRRLREALPVVTSPSRARKLERVARRLTRALGPVRELDVALLMLEELAASRDVPRPGVACLQQVIGEERSRLHRHMARSVDRCDVEKLTRRVVAAARKRAAARPASPRVREPLAMAQAHRRAARRADRLRAAIDNAAGIYLPDRLHDVRIAVKKLRYAMEVARDCSGSRATARLATLKRAQDLLGRMHDLEVLIARTRAIQGSANAPNLRLSGDLDRLVRHLEAECRQLHGQYITMRPSLLSVCDHAMALAERAAGRRASAA